MWSMVLIGIYSKLQVFTYITKNFDLLCAGARMDSGDSLDTVFYRASFFCNFVLYAALLISLKTTYSHYPKKAGFHHLHQSSSSLHFTLIFCNEVWIYYITLKKPCRVRLSATWKSPQSELQSCHITTSNEAADASAVIHLCAFPSLRLLVRLPAWCMFHLLMNSSIFPDRQMCSAHPQHL